MGQPVIRSAMRSYLRKRFKTISGLVGQSETTFSDAEYHKLRVEIKRLRATLDVLVTTNKKFPKERFFKPFRKLFRQAGVVRELQLEEEVLKTSEIPGNLPEYINRLQTTLVHEKRIFFSLRRKLSPKKIKALFNDLKEWIRQVNKKDFQTFLRKKKKKIKTFISLTQIQVSELHKLRKLLKEHGYVESIVVGKNKPSPGKDAFQELLGEWHDHVVMASHFQRTIDAGNLSSAEQEHLEMIKDKLLAESNALFVQIHGKKSSDGCSDV